MRSGVRVCLDLGSKRIGVAKCDPAGILASPIAVWNSTEVVEKLADLIHEFEPIEIIIGLPIDLRGEQSIAAQNITEIAKEIGQAFVSIPVRLVDERLTTKVARGQLQQSGYTTKSDKGLIDAIAATVLLEDALEFERRTGNVPGQVL